jgi:hypothetical protein
MGIEKTLQFFLTPISTRFDALTRLRRTYQFRKSWLPDSRSEDEPPHILDRNSDFDRRIVFVRTAIGAPETKPSLLREFR